MKKLKPLIVLLILCIFFTSCDYTYENPNPTYSFDIGNPISSDFLGQVVDENNNPIQNATITIGTTTVQTDVNGFFIINDANVFEKLAYIKAKKSGFIDGSRSLIPTDGTNNVKIMMLSGTVVGTVSSGTASNVTLPNGTKVVFDGNFKTEAGVDYSGTVNVIMHHLDPADSNISDKMPGMLFAQNTLNEATILETYGMVKVELRGSAGQKLQIKNTAQIEMPITVTQQAIAPSTIPLWHFNDTYGYWIEEGSAVKTVDKYVGTVSHFSWWNCDAPFPTVTLSVKVVDNAGNSLSNVGVSVSKTSDIYPRISYSDEKGQVSGLIPANESLVIKVYDNCGNVIKTSSIGPFYADTKLPNIIINDGSVQSTLIKGNIIKCDNTNVTNGYVLLKYGSYKSAHIVNSGNFSFRNLTCATNNDFTLEGFDYDNLQTTGEINYKFTSPITYVGNLKACNTISEFISYQIDTNPIVYFVNVSAYRVPNGGNKFYLTATTTSTNEFVILGHTRTPGIYTTTDFDMEIYGSPTPLYINNTSPNGLSFSFSSFGNVGEYVDLTFNGTYTDNNGISHIINGVAHVLRDN